MVTIADGTWAVPLASTALLVTAIVIMTVGLVFGVLGYRLWQQRHESSRNVSSGTVTEAQRQAEKCATADGQ